MTVLGTSGVAYDDVLLRNHLIGRVNAAQLERNPFCHVYMEGIFPSDLYDVVLRSLPPASLYSPLNLRKWVRSDGTSTRDQYFLTPENLAKLPTQAAQLWRSLVRAVSDGALK